jgi:hypothetical protein
MINIKKFIDKVFLVESRNGKEVVIPINEARLIKDELSKLLIDRYETEKPSSDTSLKIEIIGGKF